MTRPLGIDLVQRPSARSGETCLGSTAQLTLLVEANSKLVAMDWLRQDSIISHASQSPLLDINSVSALSEPFHKHSAKTGFGGLFHKLAGNLCTLQ